MIGRKNIVPACDFYRLKCDTFTARFEERRRLARNRMERRRHPANQLAETARRLPVRELPGGSQQTAEASAFAGGSLTGRGSAPRTGFHAADWELCLRDFV
jgi:hypothetical protein